MIHTAFKLLKDCDKLVWILQDKKSFIQNILNAILKYVLLLQFFKFSRFQSIYLLGNPNYISTMKCFFNKFGIKLNGIWPCICHDVLLDTYSQGRSSVPPDKSISHSRNKWQIEICIPVCIVRSEFMLRELLCIWSDWKSLNG